MNHLHKIYTFDAVSHEKRHIYLLLFSENGVLFELHFVTSCVDADHQSSSTAHTNTCGRKQLIRLGNQTMENEQSWHMAFSSQWNQINRNKLTSLELIFSSLPYCNRLHLLPFIGQIANRIAQSARRRWWTVVRRCRCRADERSTIAQNSALWRPVDDGKYAWKSHSHVKRRMSNAEIVLSVLSISNHGPHIIRSRYTRFFFQFSLSYFRCHLFHCRPIFCVADWQQRSKCWVWSNKRGINNSINLFDIHTVVEPSSKFRVLIYLAFGASSACRSPCLTSK